MNEAIVTYNCKFASGMVFITTQAQDFFKQNNLEPKTYLDRHFIGDWGDLCNDDKEANEYALENNERIFSAYKIKEDKIYIITEFDRSMTTVMLCQEY